MLKDDRVYICHMLDKCEEALNLAQGKSRSDFDADQSLRLALAHLIQIIGEAARRVSRDYQKDHPSIPWSQIVGMRHKIVHDYMDIDEDMVWSVVETDLSELLKALQNINS